MTPEIIRPISDDFGPPLPCSNCRAPTPINLLDPLLLDDDGNDASDELYCRVCHPHMALRYRVRDTWRPL